MAELSKPGRLGACCTAQPRNRKCTKSAILAGQIRLEVDGKQRSKVENGWTLSFCTGDAGDSGDSHVTYCH